MTQSLVIYGKEYIPSNVLASQCGYSHDYIGKLAREEKILGTQVGRQWFIEPGSLHAYLAQVEIEKKIRKEELSRVRRIEHEAHQKKTAAYSEHASEFAALAQAVVVVVCGGIVGALGWTAVSQGVEVHDLRYGVTDSMSRMAEALVPDDLSALIARDESQVAVALVSQAEPEVELIFADLPQILQLACEEGDEPLTAEDVAEAVWYTTTVPGHVCINDLVITCTQQANAIYFNRK